MEPGLGQDNYYTLIFSNVRLLKRLCSFLSLLLSFFFFFSFSIKFISWFWVGRSVRWETKKPFKKSFTKKKKERKKEKNTKSLRIGGIIRSRVKFLFSSSEEIRGTTGHVSENDQSAGRCWLQNGKSAQNCDSVCILNYLDQNKGLNENKTSTYIQLLLLHMSLMNNSIIVCYLW